MILSLLRSFTFNARPKAGKDSNGSRDSGLPRDGSRKRSNASCGENSSGFGGLSEISGASGETPISGSALVRRRLNLTLRLVISDLIKLSFDSNEYFIFGAQG